MRTRTENRLVTLVIWAVAGYLVLAAVLGVLAG
jgi:hypothetical protein